MAVEMDTDVKLPGRVYKWRGLLIGDTEAASALIGLNDKRSYQAYTRRTWTSYRPPPGFVHRDQRSGVMMYPLAWLPDSENSPMRSRVRETVAEWHAGRPGKGYWNPDRFIRP